LDLHDGSPIIKADFLGRGHFAEAYMAGSYVYLLVNGDSMKEALCQWCDPRPHLPEITDLGESVSGSWGKTVERKVYRMLWYAKLEKTRHPKAWAQFRALEKLMAEACADIQHKYRDDNRFGFGRYGFETMQLLCRKAHAAKLPRALCQALDDLCDAASLYGSGCMFEFSRRNLGVDTRGRLILRDVLFDAEKLEDEMRARRRGALGY
jgi:hypothetical protein